MLKNQILPDVGEPMGGRHVAVVFVRSPCGLKSCAFFPTSRAWFYRFLVCFFRVLIGLFFSGSFLCTNLGKIWPPF